MNGIASQLDLKKTIEAMEAEQLEIANQIKESFGIAAESLKPINIMKRSISEGSGTPVLLGKLIGAAAGLVGGYLSRKLIVRGSNSMVRKFLGTALQVGVTNFVALYSVEIQAVGMFFIRRMLRPKRIR
jgi:hypothetical protein